MKAKTRQSELILTLSETLFNTFTFHAEFLQVAKVNVLCAYFYHEKILNDIFFIIVSISKQWTGERGGYANSGCICVHFAKFFISSFCRPNGMIKGEKISALKENR
jgi:hypothetical protein